MNKSQIENLIQFSWLFHNSHNNFITCDPSYIKEKWDKYIGVDPSGINKFHTNPKMLEWKEKWHVSDNTFNELKDILNFIVHINNKHFFIGGKWSAFNVIDKVWLTSDMILLFEELIGPVNTINKDFYNHMHPNLTKVLNTWKEQPMVLRDYKLAMLV
jgi:hypothetical protein